MKFNFCKKTHDYATLMRWDKPIGTLLLLWPTLTALWIANNGQPSAKLIFIFTLGVFIMRAAGCIINDLTDKNFDRFVARTHNRPLTANRVSKREAVTLTAILLIIAAVTLPFLNCLTFIYAVLGLLITLIYPWLKRMTNLPQLGLGIAFNWGIPMTFAASLNQVPIVGWYLFIIGILFTLVYDTFYAMVDKEDDLKLGLKSTAILFGKQDRFITALLQIIIISGLLMLGITKNFNGWFYAGLMGCALTFIYQQILITNRARKRSFQAFLNNQWSLFFIFAGVFLAYQS